ncbi:MAG: hypothetical protein ACLSAF_13440 [Intestinimonas sp.]
MTASGVERSIDLTPPWVAMQMVPLRIPLADPGRHGRDSVRGERRGHRHRAPAQFPGHLGRILDTVAPEYRYQNSNSWTSPATTPKPSASP